MERIKIENLLNQREIKAEEMSKVFGGGSTLPVPDFWQPYDAVLYGKPIKPGSSEGTTKIAYR